MLGLSYTKYTATFYSFSLIQIPIRLGWDINLALDSPVFIWVRRTFPAIIVAAFRIAHRVVIVCVFWLRNLALTGFSFVTFWSISALASISTARSALTPK